MYQKLKANLIDKNLWTNVYGLSRSFIALASLVTLLLNDISFLIKPSAYGEAFPICNGSFSIFCFGANNYYALSIIKYICIIVLILVVTGWRPRYTGILHWYISYSMFSSLVVADGGEQVAAVITFLLIPITITDKRKSHWSNDYLNNSINSKIVAYYSWIIIRIQVAILYFHSTVAKFQNSEWVDGTAVYYYTKDSIVGFNDFFSYVTQPLVQSFLVVIPTWGTILVQLLIFAALFIDKKYWSKILVVAILMHEVFALMLGLVSFSLTMVGVLIIYLTPLYNQIRFNKLTTLKGGEKFEEA